MAYNNAFDRFLIPNKHQIDAKREKAIRMQRRDAKWRAAGMDTRPTPTKRLVQSTLR